MISTPIRSLLFASGLAAAAAPALAEPSSPWVREGSTELRLVDAGSVSGSNARLAAIAIRLEPGWKTYWRQPGASGVPPRFDFSGSRNVADARVAFPAPERSEGEDGVTNVYHGEVTLPVTVTPRDPSATIDLRLVADYGVCEKVCVPTRVEANLALQPDGGAPGPDGAKAREVASRTPRPAALGASGPLAVNAVTKDKAADGDAVLEIAVSAPDGDGEPVLFAETGEGDFAPAPERLGASKDGRATFRMVFDEPELPASGLRLTLAAGAEAVETPVALDAIAARP